MTVHARVAPVEDERLPKAIGAGAQRDKHVTRNPAPVCAHGFLRALHGTKRTRLVTRGGIVSFRGDPILDFAGSWEAGCVAFYGDGKTRADCRDEDQTPVRPKSWCCIK